jgi:hypothetical protein
MSLIAAGEALLGNIANNSQPSVIPWRVGRKPAAHGFTANIVKRATRPAISASWACAVAIKTGWRPEASASFCA